MSLGTVRIHTIVLNPNYRSIIDLYILFNKYTDFCRVDLEGGEDEDEETPIYEKYDALLHGNSRKKTDKIVSGQFIKKYVHIAKVSSLLFFIN